MSLGEHRIDCARCGGVIARLSLHADEGPDRGRLHRVGWMGECTKYGSLATLGVLFELVRSGRLGDARGADADFVAFHCSVCGKAYCGACWAIGPPEFDDGFYDYTMGTCPEGHEQMVDD